MEELNRVSKSKALVLQKSLHVSGILTLPGTAGSRDGHVTSNLRGPRNDWGRHWRRKGKDLSLATICTNIVLVGSELSAFSRDTLKILL